MISIKNIRKSFGDKVILEDISGVMQTGKCNLIIGSSGSGKTVLTKCIVGLFKPDSGEVCYDSKNMLEMNREERTASSFRHTPPWSPAARPRHAARW